MSTSDLPDAIGWTTPADSRWLEEFGAWTADREGAIARRRLVHLGERLRDSVIGTQAADTPEVILAEAPTVVEVLLRHPLLVEGERRVALVNVFEVDPTIDLTQWRADGLDVLSRGATALALTGSADDRVIPSLMATAFGPDLASGALRELVLGRKPAELGLPLPAVPMIDYDKLQQAVIWGTLLEVLSALRRAGSAYGAYADWAAAAHAHANGITGLEPARGCAGDLITIRGTGFGATTPPHTIVQFPKPGGGCLAAEVATRAGPTPGASSPAWSDTEIAVRAPANVGHGCVGFVVTQGGAPTDPISAHGDLVTAAGMLQSVLGDAFGPAGVLHGQMVVDAVGHAGASLPQLPCPPCTGSNRFLGGPPVIGAFTVNGGRSVELRPGGQITLAWNVTGADTVTVTARTAPTSHWPAALPAVPLAGPLPEAGSAGPFAVPWEGVDDWDGDYVLEAGNRCGVVTDAVGVEMREPPPLLGIADTHVHFMSHLAFAGYGIWGRPHASDPTLTGAAAEADALPWCSGPRGHGPGGILPSLEGAGTGHLVGGNDQFDGWPRHTTLAHQQAYVDWIKRAVDGGLRLVVCLAVNNELLSTRMTELYGPNLAVDDASAIVRQLDAVAAMVQFVDDQAGGPGLGWMEIATTPADARRIVAAGKLAIVLGVEVDTLGGWATPAGLEADASSKGTTPAALVAATVQDLYDRGVRHVFPVHASNNAFGGPALFVRNYDAVNYFKTGSSFSVEAADPALGIAYRLDEDDFEGGGVAEVLGYHGLDAAKAVAGGAVGGLALGGMVGAPVGGAVAGAAITSTRFPCPPSPTNWSGTAGGHINAQGLTQHGETLVDELMRRGMLIDIDHMGHKTTERVFQLCEDRRYPLVSGHTGLRELKYGWRPSLPDRNAQYSKQGNANDFGTLNVKRLASEVDKTPEQLERIRRLGGLVSVFTYQRDVVDGARGHGTVANDSAGSSKSLAQAFLYTSVHMHGRRVALGSDANGAGQLPGPRFGPQGAAAISDPRDYQVRRNLGRPLRVDQVFAQQAGVRYATPVQDYRHHRFMDYAGHPAQAPFDGEQRDFWEAIAIWRSGTVPEQAEQPPVVQRTIATQNFIINLATGLRATSRSDLPIDISFPLSKPWPFYNVNHEEQLAAYLASHPEPFQPSDPPRTRELTTKLSKVWAHWQEMEHGSPSQATDGWTQRNFGPPPGSGLYDARGSMIRSTAGRRDYDVNIDGMAHYGLLPDLLQDLRNVGVQLQDMAALYRSAEDYIRVWERCEATRPRS
jgi:microsomal dipeptidase-like Zn-dependent dipeptidase